MLCGGGERDTVPWRATAPAMPMLLPVSRTLLQSWPAVGYGSSLQTPPLPTALPLPQVGREELIQFLRRTSRTTAPSTAGTSATSSMYRGVSRHAKGRWEARIGLAPVDGKRRYK